jgi:hypothetical protein
MIRWQRVRGVVWGLLLAAVGGMLCTGPAAAQAEAADRKKLDCSLKWIPADAAFYSAMLRNREQIEIVRNSKAFAKLMDMPVVKEAFKKFEKAAADDPESPAAKFQEGINNPLVQDLLGLLADMFSRDVFVYGDEGLVDLLELAQKLNGAQQSVQIFGQIAGKSDELTKEQLQARVMLHLLANNLEQIRIPDLVAGFQVKNTDRAQSNLDNLMGFLTLASMNAPELQGFCKRTTVCGNDYVTVTVKGSQIQWDQVPLDDLRKIEMEKGEVDKVVDRVKQLTLVVAIGLRDDYLLVSIGESTEELARLGASKLLVDRPELKPLRDFADRRLTSISYVSKAMNERLATSKEDIDELAKVVEQLLAQSPLSAKEKAGILKDVLALADDVKPLIPEFGAALAFSFLTDTGMESYAYNWGKGFHLDGSKPLALLEHVGGSPLFAAVSRSVNTREGYELLAKWAKVGYRYFDRYAVGQMDADDREEYERFVKAFGPLVKRGDKVTREKLLPSLGDGQSGLVVEGKLKVEQVAAMAPAFDKPMPLPEVALVLAIRDADQFAQALNEYRQILNEVLGRLHEEKPGEVPDVEISDAQWDDIPGGTLYHCPLPAEAGIDKRIAPCVALSDDVAVLSLSLEQAKRLLKATPLKVGGALSKPSKPRAAAFVFQWAALLDTAKPWLKLGTEEVLKKECPTAEDADKIRPQAQTAVELLQVFRTLTGETYFDHDALVRHQVVELRDVK